MARHSGRRGAGFGDPGAVGGNTGHQHDGLRIGGQRQRLFGPFLDELADILAQRIRGFRQRLRNHRMIAPGVQHADGLRALAGKNKSERFQTITP